MRSGRWPESRPLSIPLLLLPHTLRNDTPVRLLVWAVILKCLAFIIPCPRRKRWVSQKYRQLLGRLRAYLLPIGLETAA
jgi:hypothetical protein